MNNKKIDKTKFNLDPILTKKEANTLIDECHKERLIFHKKRINDGGSLYKLEKSMYISFDELKQLMSDFEETEYENLGIKFFFAKYDKNQFDPTKNHINKDWSEHNGRSTIVLWITHDSKDRYGKDSKKIKYSKFDEGFITRPPASNYGGLCPPGC